MFPIHIVSWKNLKGKVNFKNRVHKVGSCCLDKEMSYQSSEFIVKELINFLSIET